MAIKVNEKGPGAALVLDYMPFTQGGGVGGWGTALHVRYQEGRLVRAFLV